MQIKMFPRLGAVRRRVRSPRGLFARVSAGNVSAERPSWATSPGEVVSINKLLHLFKDILTPVQLDGLRLLVTPFPQEEFNPTDDRKTAQPSLGVTCLDCHVNGHTSGQFSYNSRHAAGAAAHAAGHR